MDTRDRKQKQTVCGKILRPILVELPPKELMTAFTEKITPPYAKIIAKLHQTCNLVTQRDTLLPELPGGELSIAAGVEDTGVVE